MADVTTFLERSLSHMTLEGQRSELQVEEMMLRYGDSAPLRYLRLTTTFLGIKVPRNNPCRSKKALIVSVTRGALSAPRPGNRMDRPQSGQLASTIIYSAGIS